MALDEKEMKVEKGTSVPALFAILILVFDVGRTQSL